MQRLLRRSVDAGRSAALKLRKFRERADHRNVPFFFQRQDPVIFQQDCALRGGFHSKGMFFFQRQPDFAQGRSVGVLFSKTAKPPDRLLRFLPDESAIVPIGKLLQKGRRVGHCEVDSRPQRLAAMAHRTPIGYDDAIKSQRAAQNFAQKVRIL